MATRKPKRFEQGGITEAEDKARGLKASKDDKVGFFERLRMGNIDDEGSEAYRRFGAGRGKAERLPPAEDRVATTQPAASKPETESTPNSLLAAGAAEGARKDTGDANVAEMYSGPRTKPIESSSSAKVKPAPAKSTPAKVKPAPAKSTRATSAPKKSSDYPMTGAQPITQTYDRTGGPTAEELSNYQAKTKNANYSNETRGREMTKKQQAEYELDSIRPTAEQTQKGLETAATMMGGAGLKSLSAAAKKLAGSGKKAAPSSRELANVTDEVTYLGKSGRRQVGGFDEVGRNSAKRITDNPTRQLPAPPKQLGGPKAPDKKKMTKKEEREKKTLNPLAWMAGPKGMADDFKKGGKVKMASGGAVSGASRRGDGIATRGKTNCKMR